MIERWRTEEKEAPVIRVEKVVDAEEGEDEEEKLRIQELLEHYEEKMLRADIERAQATRMAEEHFVDACARVCISAGDMGSECGGWPSAAHIRFCDIFKAYHADKHGRKAVLERLQMELPKFSQQGLVAHYEWHSQKAFLKSKLKALQISQEQQKLAIVAEMSAAVQSVRQLAAERRAHLQEVARFEAERQMWHQELRRCRREAASLALEAAEVAEEDSKRRQAVEEEAEAKRRAYLESQRKALQAHQRKQAQEAEKRRQEAQLWQREMDERAQRRRHHNRERVAIRKGLHEQKMDQVREAQTQADQDKLEREARLERLREQVRIIAEADAQRTMGKTVSSAQTKDHAKSAPLFKNDGFDIQQLMSDNRFRLATVLNEAGMGGGTYAREVMLSKQPAPRITKSEIIL
eukprot:TRINITY_DN16926_c0_g1_i4.p1 TRINITY_DN16926_c0_g1~~TRINITY_DN16926_c0_g1_i4.p1  ORF type:complete len:407 (-),score=91.28 TRINITY_DN16926_c0_g1_i4:219-1439(-)